MRKIQFKKEIHAPAEKVYNIMLGINSLESYKQWTAAFNPTSTIIGNWEKGSKMLFIGTDETGKQGGMVSRIEENIPNKFVSICHYGILDGETEITEGPLVEVWAGGHENYTLEENNGQTTITVDIDVAEEYLDYFNETWPKALDILKQICEN